MKKTFSDKLMVTFIYAFILLFSIACIYPLIMAVMVSFTDENTVVTMGYKLIPSKFSLEAYKFTFSSLGYKLLNGYKITFLVTVFGTLLSMIFSSTYAYAASVKSFRFRNVLNLLLYIPMVFSAGILPWYIVLSKYYNLTDQIFALIAPYTMNLFFVFLIRNYFSTIPNELLEAARIDGAGHMRIYTSIYIPVARVGLITVALFYALQYWNDFYLALMFMRTPDLYPLQYYLYNILSTMSFIASSAKERIGVNVAPPLETVKMAVTIVAIGPILLLYPLFQKYFVKGVVVGAVKG